MIDRNAVNDALLEEKWAELGDVPFDDDAPGEDMKLAENWWIFEAGTEREDIWHFFDENHTKGVAFLLYEEKTRRLRSCDMHEFNWKPSDMTTRCRCQRCGSEVSHLYAGGYMDAIKHLTQKGGKTHD